MIAAVNDTNKKIIFTQKTKAGVAKTLWEFLLNGRALHCSMVYPWLQTQVTSF